MRLSRKGFGYLLPLAIGLITLSVGLTLVYILPEYIISALNSTSAFTAATIAAAQTAVNSIRALGYVVIVISVIWVLIAVISGGKKGGAM
jgi:beta-lactamase regulating signal transducer with metallopeptidase domain